MNTLIKKEGTIPSFSVYLANILQNVTGDGTFYHVIFDAENYNIDSVYDLKTGIFTAPVNGKYLFDTSITVCNLNAAHTSGLVNIKVNSKRLEFPTICNVGAIRDNTSSCTLSSSCMVDLYAKDIVISEISVFNSTKTVQLPGSSWFCGVLLF